MVESAHIDPQGLRDLWRVFVQPDETADLLAGLSMWPSAGLPQTASDPVPRPDREAVRDEQGGQPVRRHQGSVIYWLFFGVRTNSEGCRGTLVCAPVGQPQPLGADLDVVERGCMQA